MQTRILIAAFLLLISLPSAASAQQVAVATTNLPEQAEIQKVEDSWSEAINKQDQFALENALSNLYIDIASNGDVRTRDQFISLLVTKSLNIQGLEQKVVTIRLLNGAAVASGTYTYRRKGEAGAIVEEKGVFTHIFQRAHNGWVCIQSQRTAVSEQAPAKAGAKGTKQGKKSNAELPFHLPF